MYKSGENLTNEPTLLFYEPDNNNLVYCRFKSLLPEDSKQKIDDIRHLAKKNKKNLVLAIAKYKLVEVHDEILHVDDRMMVVDTDYEIKIIR